MSWAEELYRVYEQQCGVAHEDGSLLLPVAHSTANAQIEVTLRHDGSFVTARALTKEEGQNTIIPVTEDSGARTSGICAMPFADKLIYLAGDYAEFTGKDNAAHFAAYTEQITRWHESAHSHPAVDAVYTYIAAGTLLHDLVGCHNVLTLDNETGMLDDKVKIAGIAQADAFVRFIVHGGTPSETWCDQSLYDSFIAWNNSEQADAGLCYATGETAPITYKHPSKLRNTGDKAKLISANDESGFTYRGRFADKTQAIAVSYDFSQKMHNALRWLIVRQGIQFDTMTLVVWTSSTEDFSASLMNAAIDPDDDEYFDEPITHDTEPLYRDFLRKRIFGTKAFDIQSKVMLMGVDAATTGRLSVAIYEELEQSRLMEQLAKWHAETAVTRYYPKQRISRLNSFSVKEIIRSAFGMEGDRGYLEVKPELEKDNVLRLLPCITQGRRLPDDIVQKLVQKASNPLAYEHCYRTVLETACGMIRKQNIEKEKGVTAMAYDPNEKDRSYLFGCLLAIADAAERAAYDKEDINGGRITNAKRYWNRFVRKPAETWAYIYEKLLPYLNHLNKSKEKHSLYAKYMNLIKSVKQQFSFDDYMKNEPLSSAYLLGYHQYQEVIYKNANTDKED